MIYDPSRKSDTLAKGKRYIADVSLTRSRTCFRINNGSEFTFAASATSCDKSRIYYEYTARTPESMALSSRMRSGA